VLVESRSPAGFADNQKERDADTAMVHSHKFMGHTYEWELRLVNDIHSFFDSNDSVIDSLAAANRSAADLRSRRRILRLPPNINTIAGTLIQCEYFTL
jgi:hypothetical protein